jgi:uridine phosphorylase
VKYHVGLERGEVGGYLLMPGDPFRVPLVAEHLEGASERAWSREFRTFTGRIGDTEVSVCSSGIGGPSTAIAVEELRDLGVHTFLRVGTCGGGTPDVRRGDLVIATGAVRGDGTSDGYVPREYPAVASPDVVGACQAAARASGARHHVGLVRTVDALYADLDPEGMPAPGRERATHDLWARAGVVASDMESATLMVVATLRGRRAGAILLCVDEVGAGEIAPVDRPLVERLARVAVDAVARLIEADGGAAR